MFLVKLPDTIDLLTMSMMYRTITSLYTCKSVVGIGSSSRDLDVQYKVLIKYLNLLPI